MPSLDGVPDEVIQHILHFVSPDDNLRSVQLLSKRFNRLANEALLWRHYCRISFRYWAPEHQFQEKLQGLATDVDWKDLWMIRRRRNSHVGHLLDGILTTQVGRIKKFEQICLLGYDAKDFLLEQCHTDESAEDVLARRYYGKKALDSIHRGVAVDIWSQVRRDPFSTKGLDRALAAFDMFVMHEDHGDVDNTCRRLDALAAQFREAHPKFEDMTTRGMALALVHWLRKNKLTGMDDPERNYRNIRNCLIGEAIQGDDHPSLPLISSAIFCCVAERLGLVASCCAVPTHVHVNVHSPPGMTLDGKPRKLEAKTDDVRMYLDPYSTDEEVTTEAMRLKIATLGFGGIYEAEVADTTTIMIIHRNSNNILATWSYLREIGLEGNNGLAADVKRLRFGDPDVNMKALKYAVLWCSVLTTPLTRLEWGDYLAGFLPSFAGYYSEDMWLVRKVLAQMDAGHTLYNLRPRDGLESVDGTLRILRNLDQRRQTCNRRYAAEVHGNVLYKIGQVFRHKRYGYLGIINGWDPEGTGTLPVPHGVDVDEIGEFLENVDVTQRDIGKGNKGTFYTCLCATLDRRVVRQENVDIITNPNLIPKPLMNAAGKYFKRFDSTTCTFVSNIEEIYPDD